MQGLYILIALGFLLFIVIAAAVSWYRIVPSSQAHLVISGSGNRGVYSSDEKFRTKGAGNAYFAIPEWLPYFGRVIRILDVTIQETVIKQETIEKDQARYMVTSSTKYRVVDVQKAAESVTSNGDLEKQLKEIIQAAVREVTVKYDVVNTRAKRKLIGDEILKSIKDDLANWGTTLINFALVDFEDAPGSTVITDISKRREVEINATTREQNAEKVKQARMKEAEADEKAQEREIQRDKVVGERKQQQAQAIAEKEKVAQEKVFEVKKVQQVKQAEINKQEAIVKAEEEKATEQILKEKKKLEGEGDRLKLEQQAKGQAAEIFEKLSAEAKGKDELQKALNQFGTKAIAALTAELQINANKEVGIAGAEAFKNADMRVFAGSDDGKGFDVGKLLTQVGVANSGAEYSLLNRTARPNDLGLSALGLEKLKEQPKLDKKRVSKKNNKSSKNTSFEIGKTQTEIEDDNKEWECAECGEVWNSNIEPDKNEDDEYCCENCIYN